MNEAYLEKGGKNEKGFIKKLMLLGLTVITLGAGLTGCAQEPNKDISSDEQKSFTVATNAYIVVSENGKETLHKGNVVVPYKEEYQVYRGFSYTFPTVLEFNCGKELQTSQYVAYPQGCPKEDKYDEVCDCAYAYEPTR